MSDIFAETDTAATPVPEVTVPLGETVIYRNRDGREMAAMVIATPATTFASMPGTVHLQVFSPNSGQYVKRDVAEGEGPTTWNAR